MPKRRNADKKTAKPPRVFKYRPSVTVSKTPDTSPKLEVSFEVSSVPVQLCNYVVSQLRPDEVVLSLFQIPPPLSAQHAIKGLCLGRFSFTPAQAIDLHRILTQTLLTAGIPLKRPE